MRYSEKEMLDRLKLEVTVIERGGYHPSVRTPHTEPRLFRDSVSCLNLALETKEEPCSDCHLYDFVPEEHRNKEIPCHYIPLNAKGDTVASLEAAGKHEEAEKLLLAWLKSTIRLLESGERFEKVVEAGRIPRAPRSGIR